MPILEALCRWSWRLLALPWKMCSLMLESSQAASKERVGYPTQKPLALLERIISASSTGSIEGDHETVPYAGDVVLEPVLRLRHRLASPPKSWAASWVGIDLSEMAEKLVRQRLFKEVAIASEGRPHAHERHRVTHRTDIPHRTDIDAPIPYRQNKHVLFGQQEGLCNGCKGDFPFKLYEVDHRVPRSRGGTDHLDNLQLLCSSCNRIKGRPPPGIPGGKAGGDWGVRKAN